MRQGDIAEQLFDDYNNYRFQTRSVQARGGYRRSISTKHMPKFVAMERWCRERGIDSRRWLHSLFVVHRWMFPPKLNSLCREKHIERFHRLEDMPAFTAQLERERQQKRVEAGTNWDRNRDLSASSETLKARYLASGLTGRCISLMDSETFGYHPKSHICQHCPAQAQCAQILMSKVSFDIMALRRGEITSEQARVVAYVRGS